MPTTSDGTTVYATPSALESYVQQDGDTFSLADSFGDPTEWRAFLEARQVEAKARIDEYVGRDFEDHPSDTVTRNGGATGKRILALPSPVRSVSEVRVDGDTVPTEEYVVDTATAQLVRVAPPSTSVADRLAQRGKAQRDRPEWPTGYGNIAVDFDWGYQSPPADVAEAEKKLVNNTLSGLAQMREGMIVQQDDVDVTVNLPSAMTAEIRGLLAAHRDTGRTMGVI
ncbi:hypothetical protein [Haloarcula sp. 1CSR25-25]|uniref:hypothetical protein n=1 Tax=Haloarcula sp. 1CSR25-25 TaxID=2862545 RepID=UPI0028950233|nr:hypothetical protein [Haloarcula sp. 1CSR25-25]MDT3434690.1 hypothetical protein [Haloarcula sp. 1CSR25-25]